jgi:hypothetical protein
MKTYWWIEVYFQAFLASALHGSEWSTLAALPAGKGPLVTIAYQAIWKHDNSELNPSISKFSTTVWSLRVTYFISKAWCLSPRPLKVRNPEQHPRFTERTDCPNYFQLCIQRCELRGLACHTNIFMCVCFLCDISGVNKSEAMILYLMDGFCSLVKGLWYLYSSPYTDYQGAPNSKGYTSCVFPVSKGGESVTLFHRGQNTWSLKATT